MGCHTPSSSGRSARAENGGGAAKSGCAYHVMVLVGRDRTLMCSTRLPVQIPQAWTFEPAEESQPMASRIQSTVRCYNEAAHHRGTVDIQDVTFANYCRSQDVEKRWHDATRIIPSSSSRFLFTVVAANP